MTHGEKAEQNFKNGCNCAQAVLVSYADELNIDVNTAMKLASSFGGGMGRLREVCGAVSAIFMVAGLKYGYENGLDNEAKKAHYELIQALAGKFKAENGSIICRELLNRSGAENPTPEKRSAEYYKKRPCALLCHDACNILDEMAKGKQNPDNI